MFSILIFMVDQLLLDKLERPDRSPELFPLAGVAQGLLVGAAGHAHVCRADGEALDLEVLHELVEALALLAHKVALVAFDVLQVHLVRAAHVVPILLSFEVVMPGLSMGNRYMLKSL